MVAGTATGRGDRLWRRLPGPPGDRELPGRCRFYDQGYNKDDHDGQDEIYEIFLLSETFLLLTG